MSGPSREAAAGPHLPAAEGPLERFCRLLCVVTFAVMIGVIGLDIVTRTLFNFSFQISDEIGGYTLICLTFFSLAVTQANDGFHRVEFVQNLLPPRMRTASRIVYDIVTLIFAVVLIWVFVRLTMSSYRFGSTAPTLLGTPLWIPQTAMILGMVAFAAALLRTIVRNLYWLLSGAATATKGTG